MIESMDENEKDQDIRKKSGGTPVLDNWISVITEQENPSIT